ncbi:unnamed protein product [Rotaria socialis]|uniref:G-protein coupled receptors family 1 profile domain-containing protein n=1 Tax=Rotaria socialis TaxID=392032 RepID=A0A818LC10_9BILA|nr:unnamed protein product [Rotaria socialis]CAF4745987.1 unnamed protein product [Rotaria socialis]
MIQNNASSSYQLNGFNQSDSAVAMLNDSLIRIEITEFIQKVNFWITIMEIVMVICGILGNGLALIVINRRSLRDTSSSVFITYLAIFDILVLAVHITNLAISYYIQSYILHCFFAYLTDLVTFCSVWIMVIMTLERCVAVHSPFLAKRFCTTERARYSIYILIVLSIILFSSTFPTIFIVDTFQQKCMVRPRYQKIIRIIKPTIFYFVPDILLLANIFVIYELFMAKRQRTKTSMNPDNAIHRLNATSFNRKQQQLTVMLVTVSLSFYFFTTPAIIDYIRQMNPPKHHDVKRLKLRFLLTNLSVLWLQMSSATNFLFYCLAGSKFRAACIDTFSDIYDFLEMKSSNQEVRLRRRRKRQTKNDTYLSSNINQDHRNQLGNGRNRQRSTSMTQTCVFQLNDLSKQPSNETMASIQLNSRRPSTVAFNGDDA